jgi:hypothetical protein
MTRESRSHRLPLPETANLPAPPSGPKRDVKKGVQQAILRQVEAEWQRFSDLPGTHFSLSKSGWHSWEYANNTTGLVEMKCEASGQTRFPKSVSYQGRTYAWRRVGTRKFMQAARVRDLVDVGTQAPVLQRTGRHFDGGAGTRIATPSADLSFPVKGRRECAVMSAVDRSGNRLIEYRSIRRDSQWTTEIAITPDFLSLPQIHLIAAVSSRLIFDFFASAGGA